MEENNTGIIDQKEKETALWCIRCAGRYGASASRVSLSKSVMDSISMLNGEVDKVTHCADRSIFIYIYADGRYGTFSTNTFDEPHLERFISEAVSTVKMLAPDEYRTLPDSSRTEKGAVTGNELGLVDGAWSGLSADDRIRTAMKASIMARTKTDATGGDTDGNGTGNADGYSIISEECEYSDGIDDNFTCDSNGFEGRHVETSFSICSEMTIQDKDGNKYSGYEWDASPMLSRLDVEACSGEALRKAVRQIGPKPSRSGIRKMVVDSSVASKLVAPIFNALDSNAIQQKNSFLEDKVGQQVFSNKLTIMDYARTPGKTGSRLFDTEGVATVERPIIRNGVVMMNFTSTYMANKMGIEPTCSGPSRPVLCTLNKEGNEVTLKNILSGCRNGIYVTGFNGGNYNPVTGDFSYGIEGFVFQNGRLGHPVKEMLITGNMIDLWKNLCAVGTDAKERAKWNIPTVAFEGVYFSA